MARSKLELHCLGLYFGILIIMERLFLGKLLEKAAAFQHRLLLFTGGYRMGHL